MSAASTLRIGFLGAGKMATALAKGWLSAGLVEAENVLASDPLPQARQAFTDKTSLRTTSQNAEVVQSSDVVVLAVKPQSMSALLDEIHPHITSQHLIVSIAAGITLKKLSDGLGPQRRLIRVMP